MFGRLSVKKAEDQWNIFVAAELIRHSSKSILLSGNATGSVWLSYTMVAASPVKLLPSVPKPASQHFFLPVFSYIASMLPSLRLRMFEHFLRKDFCAYIQQGSMSGVRMLVVMFLHVFLLSKFGTGPHPAPAVSKLAH